ncbi:MAG: HAD family acid phosphatase [Candidatus Calescibacterium sp.]|nr:HAD family acid phosphatase [Candidatus Calescibacterium sp.]
MNINNIHKNVGNNSIIQGVAKVNVYNIENDVEDIVSVSEEPMNLGKLKNEIKHYIESGEYERQIEDVVKKAMKHIETIHHKVTNPAVVLDIDETALSNLKFYMDNNLHHDWQKWEQWKSGLHATAIKPVLELYHLCKKLDVKVFFITGRKNSYDDVKNTVLNLEKEGFTNFDGIFFRKGDEAVGKHKLDSRKKIEEMGYTIIANVGDQMSDLEGGYAVKGFKIPNPIYYVPFSYK